MQTENKISSTTGSVENIDFKFRETKDSIPDTTGLITRTSFNTKVRKTENEVLCIYVYLYFLNQ